MSARTRISSEASEVLKAMEKRTRLTPNILARLAMALSLEDSSPIVNPNRKFSGLEFNHSTLYGQHESIFRHLAIQWAGTRKNTETLLKDHLERGVFVLQEFLSTRSLVDLAGVVNEKKGSVGQKILAQR